MRKCIAAGRALAELDHLCAFHRDRSDSDQRQVALKLASELIPIADVIINAIPLHEAQDSSAVEIIVTATVDLYRFAGSGEAAADPATKETRDADAVTPTLAPMPTSSVTQWTSGPCAERAGP